MSRPLQALLLTHAFLVATSACLPEAKDAQHLRTITIEGVEMPVGIIAMNWASSELLAAVMCTLIQERFGIKARVTRVLDSDTAAQFYLAGCDFPDDVSFRPDRTCLTVPKDHIVMDTWVYLDSDPAIKFIKQNFPKAAPVNLGSMGYDGLEGWFVLGDAWDAAMNQAGISLDWYGSYNASWMGQRDLTQFFTRMEDIDTSLLIPCNDSTLLAAMSPHLQKLDTTGLAPPGVTGADLAPVCDSSGYWWLPPACRANSSACIPLLTQGTTAWGFEPIYQLSTWHNLSLAQGVIAGLDTYTTLPRQNKTTLVYWWFPDSTFADASPKPLIFPPHSDNEWNKNIYQTGFATEVISKFVTAGIDGAASEVYDLASSFTLSMKEIQEFIVLYTSSGSSADDAACSWLLNNRNLWEPFVPSKISCTAAAAQHGNGMVDSNGSFVDSAAQALSCARCTPGRFSRPLQLGNWSTRICEACPNGFFSDSTGATACLPCHRGTIATPMADPNQPFALRTGASTCSRCPSFFFQPNVGSSTCVSCDTVIVNSISHPGSIQASDCFCEEGTYLLHRAGQQPRCMPCGTGMLCKEGLLVPLQAPGYFARSAAVGPDKVLISPPQMVKCADEIRCPSGQALGQCPPGMERLACGACAAFSRLDSHGACTPCSKNPALRVSVLILAILGLLLAVSGTMFGPMMVTRGENSMALLQQIVGFTVYLVQVLTVFSSTPLPWVEPLLSVRAWAMEVIEYIGVTCQLGINDPVGVYAASLWYFLFFCLLVSLSYLVQRFLLRRQVSSLQLINCLGRLLMTTHLFLIASSLNPWQCVRNPDGSSTMRLQPSVTCWTSKEHQTMIVMSVIAILVYIVAPVSVMLWLILKYPDIIRRGRVQLLRYFAFIVGNFKPERYFTSALMMSRDLLLGLTPIFVMETPGLMATVMHSVFLIYTALSLRLWPCRAPIMNWVQAVCFTVVLVALTAMIAAAYPTNLPAMSTFIVVVFAVALGQLLMLALGLFLHSLLQRTGYDIFISHHKDGAAVLARWLKMELTAHLTAGKVFLDCDDLSRLDSIQDIVGSKTRNLVVVLTEQTLKRIWCAAEITWAVEAKVNVVLVACDDFSPINDEFLNDIDSFWSNSEIASIGSLGLGRGQIRKAYEYLRELQVLNLNRGCLGEQKDVVRSILAACQSVSWRWAGWSLSERSSHSSSAPEILLAGDFRSGESIATLAILQRLLQQQLHLDAHILAPDEPPVEDACFILVLTKGSLSSPDLAKLLLDHYTCNNICFPLVADQQFEVPDSQFWKNMLQGKVIPAEQVGGALALRTIVASYKKLFKCLVMRLSPQSSEVILRVEVEQLGQRLQAELSEKRRSVIHHTSTEDELPDMESREGSQEAATADIPDSIPPDSISQDLPNNCTPSELLASSGSELVLV